MPSSSASAGAVRRSIGFARFFVSVQYHGGSFLGATYQGPKGEDCIVQQRRKSGRLRTIDLRGHRSVEGRLREALDDLFGKKQWENIQTSSRTDRGVHALKNTFHVDIQTLIPGSSSNSSSVRTSLKQQQDTAIDREYELIEHKLKDGLNFYLSRQRHNLDNNHPKGRQNPMMNELRILDASKSPEYMDNPYALTIKGRAQNQTIEVDWNARFSATQRTYVYRILCYHPRKQQRQRNHSHEESSNPIGNDERSAQDWNDSFGIPFEWDRAWCLSLSHGHPLDLEAMKAAAECFVGTHDFSSFRGRLCQRNSPIVTMKSVVVAADHSHGIGFLPMQQQRQKLVTITFVASSFLYRQVRNMVGCLVEVGKHGGRLSPRDVRDLLSSDWKERDDNDESSKRAFGEETSDTNHHADIGSRKVDSPRKTFKHRPYSTAPPQGLFLVDVQHEDFQF